MLVGKTQTPEFGILPVTEPRRFGPARNPWDPERTTGGSVRRVGAAPWPRAPCRWRTAATAAARSASPPPAAAWSASSPTRGRISRAPDLGDHFLSTDGALTRTTADAAALLDVMAGYELGDATWAPPPEAPFAELAQPRSRQAARGAHLRHARSRRELDPECERGAREAAAVLEALGHEVEEVEAPWKGADLLPIFTVLWAANVSASVIHGQIVTGTEPSAENIEPLTHVAVRDGHGLQGAAVPRRARDAPGVRARGDRLLGALRPRAHPRAGQAPRAPRRDRPLRREPRRSSSRSRASSRPTPRRSTSPASRRSRCRSPTATTACRPPSRSWGRRWARGSCCGVRAARGGAAVGRPGAAGVARRISSYVPLPVRDNGATVQDLLTMRSGIRDYVDQPLFDLIDRAPHQRITVAESLDLVPRKSTRPAPSSSTATPTTYCLASS